MPREGEVKGNYRSTVVRLAAAATATQYIPVAARTPISWQVGRSRWTHGTVDAAAERRTSVLFGRVTSWQCLLLFAAEYWFENSGLFHTDLREW